MELAERHKELVNPVDRRVPVNISIPIRVLDRIDEEAWRMFGTKGKRSETVVNILKTYLHIK